MFANNCYIHAYDMTKLGPGQVNNATECKQWADSFDVNLQN